MNASGTPGQAAGPKTLGFIGPASRCRSRLGQLAGRIVLFNGDNAASRDLISEIQVYFAKTGKRPLVLLTHEKNGSEVIPAFKVIRLTEDNTATPGLNHLSHPSADEKPVATRSPKPTCRPRTVVVAASTTKSRSEFHLSGGGVTAASSSFGHTP